jgi:signal transduction histidine kinase
LRNKVNVINGQATRIQDQLDGSADEGLQAIIEASDDLLMLTEKTSQLRKANHQEIASDVVNIAVLIEEVVGEVQDDFSDATIEVNALEQAEVVGASLFKIAVREVIENAIKHSNNPEPTVRVAVTSDSSSNGWVEITISDDGPGIPELEEQVLEEGTETPLQHASGLGLWVVNWILKTLGGDFTIESSNSAGTKISFKLPKQNTAVLNTSSSQFEQPER